LNKKYVSLKHPFLFLIMMFCVVLVASCESGKGDSEPDLLEWDNADLTLSEEDGTDETQLTSDHFTIWWEGVPIPTEFITPRLDDRYEQIKFQYHFNYITPFTKGSTDGSFSNLFERMMSDKKNPDLIFFDRRTLSILLEADYLERIDFETYLNLDPSILEKTRSYAPDLQLYALPLGEHMTGLFYNKEIFDDMSVPYPTEGMTWRDVIALSYQLNNPEKWAALVIHDQGMVASQLDIREYDVDPHQLDYSSEPWVRMERFIESLKGTGSTSVRSQSRFGDGEAAMFVGPVFSTGLLGSHDKPTVLRWDVATHPVFEDGRSYAPAKEVVYVGIPRTSEQKDIAYALIRYLLSEEVQNQYVHQGLASFRTDIDEERLGEATILAGKSISSLSNVNETGPFDPNLVFYHGINTLDSYARRWYGAHLIDDGYFDQYIERAKDSLQLDMKNYTEARQAMLENLSNTE